MINDLNGKKSNAAIVVAIVAAFVMSLSALVTGLVLGIRNREKFETNDNIVAHNLLIDAASGLNHTVSAMRLVNDEEPAWELSKTALVYAVRAETALECDSGDWAENRQKEAFLNDVATVLHTEVPMEAVKKSDVLFKYSSMFLSHVADGTEFSYNGEILGESPADDDTVSEEVAQEQIDAAIQLLKDVLGDISCKHIGSYGNHIEFELDKDGKPGYAVTKDDKILEFSFAHGGGEGEDLDRERVEKVALECAEKCGFGGMYVFNTDIKKNYAVVGLCHKTHDALACDNCANVAIVDYEAVAFSAGHCTENHDVPKVKVSEEQARLAAKNAAGPGILVTRKVNGVERVCYRYAYELEDGVHFVFVCAENGRQMEVQ